MSLPTAFDGLTESLAPMTRDRLSILRSSPAPPPPSKAPVSLSKKLYAHCFVLVGSRNVIERDIYKQIDCELFYNQSKQKIELTNGVCLHVCAQAVVNKGSLALNTLPVPSNQYSF